MKKYTTEIKWALIHAAMFILWMTIEKALGFHSTKLEQQQVVTMLILVPSIIIYLVALLEKRKNYYNGSITYKQSFLSGSILTLFVVLLSLITQPIVTSIISPGYFSNLINYTTSKGVLTREQAELQFNTGSYIMQSVIGGLVTGLLFSAIISIFIKSKRTNHAQYNESR